MIKYLLLVSVFMVSPLMGQSFDEIHSEAIKSDGILIVVVGDDN